MCLYMCVYMYLYIYIYKSECHFDLEFLRKKFLSNHQLPEATEE